MGRMVTLGGVSRSRLPFPRWRIHANQHPDLRGLPRCETDLSLLRPLRWRRDTCIWEVPSRWAMAVWDRPEWNFRDRIARSLGSTQPSHGLGCGS